MDNIKEVWVYNSYPSLRRGVAVWRDVHNHYKWYDIGFYKDWLLFTLGFVTRYVTDEER